MAQLLQVFGGKNIIGHGSHNLVLQEFHQQIVDVIAAEVRVTVGGKNLENVAFRGGDELEDGNVEGAAAEIVDGDFAALLFVQAVGEGRSSWFVDEAENFEAGNFTGVLGGLALGIVEMMTFLLDGSTRNGNSFSSSWTSAGPRPIRRFTE